MFLKTVFFLFLLLLYTRQAFLNNNRVNISSDFTLYYRFTNDSKIYFSFYALNNNGWIAMGFGASQTNIDVIRVYMANGNTATAQDLWSIGNFNWVLDTTVGGSDDVTVESGSGRINGTLNITVSRLLDTGDQFDYMIIDKTKVSCLFFWSNTDTTSTIYTNTPSPLTINFTSVQLCHFQCIAQSMTCTGPDITDCVCYPGSYFDIASQTCLNCIGNCSVCSDSKSCTTCVTSYFYQANPLECTLCTSGNQYKDTSSNTCAICDVNCQSCVSDISCGTCNSGYFTNTQNTCTACLANCSNCTTTSDCQQCFPGFILQGSVCNACPLNCKTCSSTSTCTVCMPNYYFSGASCVPCNSLGQLKSGASDGSGTCVSCVANCLTCATQTTCTQCGDGFLANGNTACVPCTVASCKVCNPVSTCTTCLTGYSLYLNTCQPCASKNCLGCDSNGKCLACAANYTLFRGTCTNCTVSNCAYCNPGAPDTCVYCADGYYLQANGTCAQGSVVSCAVPWGVSSCVACENQFLLIENDSCFQCSGKNCVSCSSNNICSQCATQYYLQNNLCSKCVANCDACPDQFSCSLCSAGYYLNSSSLQCQQCSVANCQTCNTSSALCDSCMSNYFLSSSHLTCTACTDQNCLSCSSAAACTNCNSGYYLSQGSCQACAQTNCLNCNSGNTCTTCLAGYTANLTQNYCAYCPFENCARCDFDYVCSACLPQYYFNNVSNSCVSCQSNCLNCQNASVCTECAAGSYLQDTSCLNCPANCQQCNQTNCISCDSGYGLNTIGQCITCNVANCLSCSTNNVCSQCTTGFTLNSTSNTCGCSAAQLWNATAQQCMTCSSLFTNCYSCNSSFCLSCNPGFYQPAGNGVCVKCNQDPNCGLCNTTNCLSCVSGYYLLPNNTCSSCFIDCSNCTGPANTQCLSCNNAFFLFSSTGQCATNNCPSSFTNCQSCVRNNNGNLVCVSCQTGYFLNPDTGKCNQCDPSCLTCSGQSSTNCLSCPSYSLYYPNTGTCVYNCSQNCLSCNGASESNCLSCANSLILVNSQCVSDSQAVENITNFTASSYGVSLQMVTFAIAIRSFTQKTASILKSCSNNKDCFNNGECYKSVCLCATGFLGIQCQISQADLSLAINKTNDILTYFISTFSSLSIANISTSANSRRILQTNSTNTTNSTTNSTVSNLNSSTLAIITSTLVELSKPIELWTSASAINSTIIFLNQILRNNLQVLNSTIITSGIQALSNMVYILNNFNASVVNLARSDVTMLSENITITIQSILNTTISSLTAVGNTYQIYTPYFMVSFYYVDLQSSQTPKFTLYSTPYYGVNDVYTSQISFTADSASLITKINGGSSKVILKQATWISANPYPVNLAVQVNLTLATAIASIEIFSTSGKYIPITGISDDVAVRIKKIDPSNTLDTSSTNQRYACAYWDNNTYLWSTDGIDNDKTTESQNYLGCYTSHFTDFTVVYRNQTDFFALTFVETQLSYVQSNYGFIACILLLILSIILVPAIAFSKYEKTGFTKRQRPAVYKNVHEIEKNLGENEEKHEINLNTFQSYDKIDDKKHSDSLNYWMFFPLYAIAFSESPSIAVQKYTILLINLMVYMTILSFCFANYTIPALQDNSVFAAFSFAAILVSWFSNYIYGFWAWSIRKKDYLRVNVLYWPIFFLVWIVLAIFISWRMSGVNTSDSNYWLLSIAICIIFDMFLFDLFIVVLAKEVGSNPKSLQRFSKYFRFRGYYE